MSEHTKEPMVWNGNELVFANQPLVGVAGIGTSQPDDIGARLAATWNACDGIPTPALEDGAVQRLVEDARYVAREMGFCGGRLPDKWSSLQDAIECLNAALAAFTGDKS